MNNKQLLQQYVDTGIPLPEYQVGSLPNDLLTTYIRKRLIAVESVCGGLSDYEFELSTPEQRFQYAMKKSYGISDKQFELLTPDQRFQYVMELEKKYKKYVISDYRFELLTPDQRFQYVMKRSEYITDITDKQFELLTPEQRFQYVMKRVEKGYPITDKQFELLTPDQQKIFKDKGGKISH